MTRPRPRPVPALRAERVSVDYGTVRALTEVDLKVEAGETVALVGPSGAGKTTLLRVLAGMLPPTRGHVTVHGRALEGLRPGRELTELVGMVQQRLDLVPQLAVKHNIQAGFLGRWGLGRSLAALLLPLESPAARQAARRVGIADKVHRRVADLSGGEQQRVALARLLVQEPRVVLADEPVAALDPARAADLLQLLAGLGAGGERTIVASLHAADLARRYFDRLVGLRDGRVVFDLPAVEVTTAVLDDLYRLLAPVDEVAG